MCTVYIMHKVEYMDPSKYFTVTSSYYTIECPDSPKCLTAHDSVL